MKKCSLLFGFLLLFLCNVRVFAQQTITGTVTGDDNAVITGVSVSVSGSTVATATDASGKYSINAASDGSLVFTHIGFATQTVAINGRAVINVALVGQQNLMDEVVVTGYTSQKRKDIIGSVAVVDVKAMKTLPAGSAMQALQGMAAGVNVINNGAPGAQSTINIRGLTSFNNAPLILIDGIQGQINDVPANDVESIQILKDAGAASRYGARGSNGVIIITTKKGKAGTTQVTYDSYYSLQMPKKDNPLNLLNAQEYAKIWYETNPGSTLFPNGQIPDYYYKTNTGVRGGAMAGDPLVDPAKYHFDPSNEGNNYLIAKTVQNGMTDMYNEIFSNALMMNQNVTVSGGTDKANYMLSLGYMDQQGTLLNTYLKRYSVRMNSQYKVKEHIRVGENLYIHFKDNPIVSPNASFGPVGDAQRYMPFMPVYDIAGNYAGPGDGPGNNDLGDGSNPVADLENTRNDRKREWLMQGNVYAEVDFLKDFTIRSSFGGNVNNYYQNTFEYNRYWKANGGGNTNRLTENSGYYTTLQWTNTLAYKKQFGKHNVSALVGSESVNNWSRSQSGQGTNFYSTDYNYLVLTQAGAYPAPSYSGASEDALFSLFAEANYSFDDKYLLGATIRRDGFSHFGKDSRYGNFPSVSAGWRISNENFMKGISWINDMKIRGSYGVLGSKEGIGLVNSFTTYGQSMNRSYYDIFGAGNSIVRGFYPERNGNTNTSWENNKLMNIGFDATIYKKFDVSIDYYEKKISGLLRPKVAPATAGEAASPLINDGNIENKGIDVSVNYREQIGRDFKFNIGINFTTYKNKIVHMADGFFDVGQIRNAEGHPISSFYGYEVLGVFADQKEVDDHATQQDAAPGRFKFRDVDTNGVINDQDRTFFGNPNPKFTMGLNLGAQYKGFDFQAIFYTSQGGDIFNGTLSEIGDWSRRGNKSKRVLDAWTETNTVTNVQKNELARNFSTTANYNSAFMEDGSFIRLRSVQLGYNINTAPLRKVGLNKARVYLQATNLFTISKYSGIDPEVPGAGGYSGVDNGIYPQQSSIVFGLNLGF